MMRCRLSSLAIFITLALASTMAAATDDYRIGPWRPDMTRDEVVAFAEHGPYEPVRVTGGLETFNAKLDGKRTNVSFVFHQDRLDYIQVWRYEGQRWQSARDAVLAAFDDFTEHFGAVTMTDVEVGGGDVMTRDALEALLERILGTATEIGAQMRKKGAAVTMTFDLIPMIQPSDSRVRIAFGYASRHDAFYVFEFQDSLKMPSREKVPAIRFEPM